MPILSPLLWIDKARKLAEKYPGDIARVTKMYDAQPKIAQVYSPLAVAKAVERSKSGQIAMLKPEEFTALAQKLGSNQTAPYTKHYADLIRNGDWTEPDDPNIFLQRYLDQMRSQPYEGYSDVPMLQYKQGKSAASGSIIGHDGRHRNMAIQDVYPNEAFPVRFADTAQTDPLPPDPYFVYPEDGGQSLDLSSVNRMAGGGSVGKALSLLKAVVYPATDAGQLAVREALGVHTAPGKFIPGNDKLFRQHMITDETMSNAAYDPTTIFHDPKTGEAKGAYQLGQRENGLYIPNIVSYQKGLGHEMLGHAKDAAAGKKVYLYAIPGSESTYRDPRQQAEGWVESDDGYGIPVFTNEGTQ